MERDRHMPEETEGRPLSAEEVEAIKIKNYVNKHVPPVELTAEEKAIYSPEQADAVLAVRSRAARDEAYETFIKENQGIPAGLRKAAEKDIGPGRSDDEIIAWANSKKGDEGARAERFGLPAVPREDWKYEWIHSQQLGEIPVEWPKDQDKAEQHIKEVLGRIELAQSSPTQQMQVDYQNAQSVLEVLEVRQTQPGLNPEQIKKQQEWATKMREEMKARLQLHNAFLAYEGAGSIDEIKKAVLGLDSGWMNVVFGLEEKLPQTEEKFNPFVVALQFYEDHGHEFARHNSRDLRGVFAEKARKHLANYIKEEALKRGVDANVNSDDYKWASNMAERMFRTTGRATMYDYLVINKDKEGERMVTLDYEGTERVEWASGRDGGDYPWSKVARFRENLRTSSEQDLMRVYIHLFDGVDLFAGDFWTRTVNQPSYIKTEQKGSTFTTRISRENYNKKLEAKIEDFKKNDGKSDVEARVEAEKLLNILYKIKDPPTFPEGIIEEEKAKMQAYYDADIYSDRDSRVFIDNKGEEVSRIDFMRMARKTENINGKDELKEGINFEKMGDTPFSLWCSRMLGGPGGVLDKLTGSNKVFGLNPNFKTLAELIDAFDYSKRNAWAVKKQLLKNLIKYLQSDVYEATGRSKLTDTEIIAGVNELSGYTNPDAPQFVQFEERTEVLAEFFHINTELSEREKVRIKLQAREQADKEIREEKPELVPESDEFKEAVRNRTAKKAVRMEKIIINSRIENRINIQFGAAFAGEFALGAVKEGLKQAFAELGVK